MQHNEPFTLTHAIVGCGRVAPFHVDAFLGIPHATIKYAVDVVPEVAIDFAHKFNIPKVCTSLEDVLSDPEVTSVSISTPHDLHAVMTLQALLSGKHVLVEKPCVIHPEDASSILRILGSSALVVMPVSQHRFDPAIEVISTAINCGHLGQMVMFRGHLECVRPRDYYSASPWRGRWVREGGSVLINQAYHLVDLMLWMAGPVTTVSAEIRNLANGDIMETEDLVVTSLGFTSGALGVLTVTGASGGSWHSYLEFSGTQGVIAFDIASPNNIHRVELTDKGTERAIKSRLEAIRHSAEPPVPQLQYYGISHRMQARAFSELIRGGHVKDAADLAAALEVIRLIQRIYSVARGVRGSVTNMAH